MIAKSITASSRFWCAVLIFLSLFFLKTSPIYVMIFILTVSLLFDRDTLRPLKFVSFWIIIALLVILVPLFTGVPDSSLWIFKYSSKQLISMVMMSLRGIAVFLLFQVMTVNLNSSKVSFVFTKLGIKHFHTLYEMSNQTIPQIRTILSARTTDFSVHWKQKRTLHHIMDLIVHILNDVIQLIELMNDHPSTHRRMKQSQLLDQLRERTAPSLTVLIGGSGSGKSQWLSQLVDEINNIGQTVDGVISEKIILEPDHWYHTLRRIATNESKQLNTMNDMDTPIQVGKFFFYPDVIEWGCGQITQSVDSDYLIIDEVGLLEFNGEGFLPALKKIGTEFKGHLIITLRSRLVNQIEPFLKNQLLSISDWEKTVINL